jgi:hypothetical protein
MAENRDRNGGDGSRQISEWSASIAPNVLSLESSASGGGSGEEPVAAMAPHRSVREGTMRKHPP